MTGDKQNSSNVWQLLDGLSRKSDYQQLQIGSYILSK